MTARILVPDKPVKVQVGRYGDRVTMRVNDGFGHTIHWKEAQEVARTLRTGTEDPVRIHVGAQEFNIPKGIAKAVAKALYAKSKLSEEWAEKERIADEGALLCRLGINIGLSDNPKIKSEIGKRAAWDTKLRRYLPGGVKSTSVVGTPSIWMPPKTRGQNNARGTEGQARRVAAASRDTPGGTGGKAEGASRARRAGERRRG